MTLNTTHVKGEGVILGEWPWNLAGVFGLGTCICVPSFVALGLIFLEKTHLGGFHFCHAWYFLKISSKFLGV